MIHGATPAHEVDCPYDGVVTAVRGSVVDIRFADNLPPIYSLLRAGPEVRIAIEVLMQLDDRHMFAGSR